MDGRVLNLFLLMLTCVMESRTECELPEAAEFPENFLFGIGTASYQIEGAWNDDGKGESVWDWGTHTHPGRIEDGSNGDEAADSYHLYQEDIKALKETGFHVYRFSISWPRIFPTGELESLNQKGLDYYNRLIDELLANGIEPIVTLFHWDLPQTLQELGGFMNASIADYFEIFADAVFENYGDRVKKWTTINEPRQVCIPAYEDGERPPFIKEKGTGGYICGHNMLLSHARVYHLYQNKYKAVQNGKIGITLNGDGALAKTNSKREKLAVQRQYQFDAGWFAHPIYSKDGGYPQIMIDTIAVNSIDEGFRKSRLPEFTAQEIQYIKGTADFLSYNYYTARYVDLDFSRANESPSYKKDKAVKEEVDPNWPKSTLKTLFSVPEGLRSLLKWMKSEYDDPEIWIVENGWSDHGQLDDEDRVQYFKEHLKVCLQSIYCDKVKLTMYSAWSLIDSFEWMHGYTQKFGIYHIDFENPLKTRTVKKSALFLKEVIKTNQIPEDF